MNNLFKVTCSDGTIMQEYGTSKADVAEFMATCYRHLVVLSIELDC